MPRSRDTRVAVFNAEAAAAAEAAALRASAAAISGDPREDEDMGRDPEAQRLLAQYVRSKISAAAAEQDGRPMMTQAQRDLASASQQRVFTSTVVRVNMPDRSVLSGTFSPLEPVSAIHEWVASLLRAEAAALLPPFFLYTTPPPTLFDRAEGTTIEGARLVPAVVLYLGWGASPSQRAALPPGGIPAAACLSSGALALAEDPLGHASSAVAVGTSVELRSLGEGLLAPPPAGGGARGDQQGKKAPASSAEARMAEMAAQLLGGGSLASAGFGSSTGAASRGPQASGRGVPSWLQTGGGATSKR